MTDEVDREELLAQIEKSLDSGDGVLWLTDRRGRRVRCRWSRSPTSKWAFRP